jgi:hypothetical protein
MIVHDIRAEFCAKGENQQNTRSGEQTAMKSGENSSLIVYKVPPEDQANQILK